MQYPHRERLYYPSAGSTYHRGWPEPPIFHGCPGRNHPNPESSSNAREPQTPLIPRIIIKILGDVIRNPRAVNSSSLEGSDEQKKRRAKGQKASKKRGPGVHCIEKANLGNSARRIMAETTPVTARASAPSVSPSSNTTPANPSADSEEEPPFSSLPTTTKSTLAISPTTSSDAPNNRNNYHDHRQSHSSSKLPAFRFTDLKKENLGHPSLLHGIPSPVTPGDTETETQIQSSSNAFDSGRDNPSVTAPVSPDQLPASPDADPEDSRTSAFQAPGTNSTEQGATPNTDARHTELPDPVSPTEAEPTHAVQLTTTTTPQPSITDDIKSPLTTTTDSTDTIVASQPPKRRAPTSSSTSVFDFASGPRQALGAHQRFNSAEGSRSAAGDFAQDSAQGQRELVLPKSVKRKSTDDKRTSNSRRPPVSYKPPGSASKTSPGGSTSIPPIRSFRSSGSRRSFGIDMNFTSPHYEDAKGADSNHRDKTLRALEGRQDDDTVRWAPRDSAETDDDSGDVFLKMAREEPESNTVVSACMPSLVFPCLCVIYGLGNPGCSIHY